MIQARIKGYTDWQHCPGMKPSDAVIRMAKLATADAVTVEVLREGAVEIKVYEVRQELAYTVNELPSVPV